MTESFIAQNDLVEVVLWLDSGQTWVYRFRIDQPSRLFRQLVQDEIDNVIPIFVSIRLKHVVRTELERLNGGYGYFDC